MPATRRSTRSAAAAAAAGAKGGSGSKQSTLSFNNKVTKHNVAKATGKDHIAPSSSSASAAKPAGKKNAAAAAAADAVLTPPPTSPPTEKVEEEEEQDVQGSVVVEEEKVAAVQVEGLGGEKKKSAGEAEVEAEAEKVTEAQIKKFWREAEAARIAKRVHQQDLSVGEKVLRYFDISSQYGPCIGIDRKKRWYRAQRLRLNPPIEVLAVLLREEKQGHAGAERSALDRLMESTAVGSL